MKEVWRKVVRWEGLYWVSTKGRVRSKRKILKGTPDSYGYIVVGLCRKGKMKTVKVHRLVLEAFVGPCPPGMEACHSPDPTRSNNNIKNISWGSKKKNGEDKVRDGNSMRGERNRHSKLTATKVRVIRFLAKLGLGYGTLATWFNVTRAAIRAIDRRDVWKHI